MRKFLRSLLSLFLFPAALYCQPNAASLRDGDLLFVVNHYGQGKAIQLATHSKYTHVGIVFIENGRPTVYHAVEPVSKSTLEEFMATSADNNYQVKRLKNRELLSDSIVKVMRKQAASQVGKHYDFAFDWSDDRLYCSEFVWKLYKNNLGIDIGSLKPLHSFDLSNPIVKAKLEERYNGHIPLDEKMISPGDMYDCPLLE